jgi:hypothetical protein
LNQTLKNSKKTLNFFQQRQSQRKKGFKKVLKQGAKVTKLFEAVICE